MTFCQEVRRYLDFHRKPVTPAATESDDRPVPEDDQEMYNMIQLHSRRRVCVCNHLVVLDLAF
jgi:hypothetical protein